MNRIFRIIAACLMAATAVSAQSSFVIEHGDLNREGPPSTFFDVYVDIINTSNQDLHLLVVRTRNAMPNPNWSSSLCNDQVCYPPETDSIYVPDTFFGTPPLAPGDTLPFHLNVWSDPNEPGVGEVDIRIENQNDPADAGSVTIITSTDASTGIAPGDPLVSDGFRLDAAYPNPFNPSTVIPFELARAGAVSLTVFNALGQPVADLLDEQPLAPGRYDVPWTAVDRAGRTLPSGTYLARLRVDGKMAISKMLLVR